MTVAPAARDRSKDAATLLAMTLPALFIRPPAAAAPFGWRTALALGMVLAGLLLICRIVRVLEGRSIAAWTAFALLYGTFLYADPAIGQDHILHATGFLLGAAALELWWRWRCSLSAPRLAAWAAVMASATALPYLWMSTGPRVDAWAIGASLFGSRQGLFYWTPLLWGGLVGYAFLLRREGRAALLPLAGILLVLCLSGGDSGRGVFFAGGRFDASLPGLAIGLSAVLGVCRDAAARRPGRVVLVGGALLVIWNILFMEQYRVGRIPNDETVSFARITENNADVLARAVGAPLAWPANWLFAWRHRLPAARYDLMVGKSLFSGPASLDGVIDLGDDRRGDPDLLADDWGSRIRCETSVCRDVRGTARVFVPLDEPERLDLTIRASGAGELGVEVNHARLAALPLAAGLGDLKLRVPAGHWNRGINEIALVCAPPAAARVDRLVFAAVGRTP
jgi:hypothetical protein